MRFGTDRKPTTHSVNGVKINGPFNGATYYYRVACRDILERRGNWSQPVTAVPFDNTPPSAPTDFTVTPKKPSANAMLQGEKWAGLALSWRKVTRDVNDHVELDKKLDYFIYRSTNKSDLLVLDKNRRLPSKFLVKSLSADPNDKKIYTLEWLDSHTDLFPDYGEVDFYYRVQCRDARGNTGSPSAMVSARLPDVIAPGPSEVTGSRGFTDRIEIQWLPNSEPDLAGYQVWRTICHKGNFYPPPQGIDVVYPCNFKLIGTVLKEDADVMMEKSGFISFTDTGMRKDSAVCFAYWVRALDRSRNLYMGLQGCPAGKKEYVCQKLYEEIPPEPPVISNVKARDNGVLLQWISSPVQDLRAFHIYRSQSQTAPPVFVACVYKDGTVSRTPWKGSEPNCRDIPAVLHPKSAKGSYLDTRIEPHKIYWYRVSALDWLGNESKGSQVAKIPAISTFTYKKAGPGQPSVQAAAGDKSACVVTVSWGPPGSGQPAGFLVFRASAAAGVYRQISPVVEGTAFPDHSVIPGKSYWYKVQAMAPDGALSKPSPPIQCTWK